MRDPVTFHSPPAALPSLLPTGVSEDSLASSLLLHRPPALTATRSLPVAEEAPPHLAAPPYRCSPLVEASTAGDLTRAPHRHRCPQKP
jgi:hypothetical protein